MSKQAFEAMMTVMACRISVRALDERNAKRAPYSVLTAVPTVHPSILVSR